MTKNTLKKSSSLRRNKLSYHINQETLTIVNSIEETKANQVELHLRVVRLGIIFEHTDEYKRSGSIVARIRKSVTAGGRRNSDIVEH